MSLTLRTLPSRLAVCRLDATATIPSWVQLGTSSSFLSVTRTDDELSIVCAQDVVPSDVKAERDWTALKVMGPLDFALTGILASLANPLGKAGISIFAMSTFDTDYLLVRADKLDQATQVLQEAGHKVD